MMARGVAEARAVAPKLVDRHFEACLSWVVQTHGEEVLAKVADGYCRGRCAYLPAVRVMSKIGVRIWQLPKPRSADM